MLIKCIKNKVDEITDNPEVRNYIRDTTGEHSKRLRIDSVYNVYAIAFYDISTPRYYIADESYVDYPMWYFSSFFEIVDHRLSQYWEFGCELVQPPNAKPFSHAILTFREWSRDRVFYERLINGDEKTFHIFDKYKKLIDNEFYPAPH